MNGKKKTLLTAGVIAAFGLAIMTSSAVYAQSDNQSMITIVQKVAKKFNLKESDVQAVFDAERQERMANMEQKFEKRLETLVSEGKITVAQKQLIIDKHKDMEATRKSEMANFKNLSQDERKAAMEKKRTELETWAKDNGIDIQYLMPMGGKGFGHGPRPE